MTAEIKVSAKSKAKSVAGAIAAQVRDGATRIESTVVGAGSLNILVKATAIARGFVTPTGKDLIIIPSFTEVDIEGEERTALYIVIEVKSI